MTERWKNLVCLVIMLGLMILLFSRILFTDMIVRAPDIMNESYWWLKSYADMGFFDLFRIKLTAAWDPLINSGHTNNGGMVSQQFLLHQRLILHLIPTPSNVAWFMVLHLFIGGAGVFFYCRLIGCGVWGSLFAGLVFSIAPENATLINAGHVMKIATISFAPWAFYFLERGFLSGRIMFFMTSAMVLAFQFFNTHWQIAFYTCLCLGVYAAIRSIGILTSKEGKRRFSPTRLLCCNLVVAAFFLSSVSISLLPLADWSKETNRGVQSGANQGKGGLSREEAMSWSMPPEELAGFIIPGFFGFSRQEAGGNPESIHAYYWGRMVFTQTTSYMGLLPWLLALLPLLFRRDRYTWFASLAIVGGVLFSMGKYTPFYNILFDVFPGINRFRVPKMIMFIPVMGLSILAGRGLDLLCARQYLDTAAFRRYLFAVCCFALALFALMGVEVVGENFWMSKAYDALIHPTRYEQGAYLLAQRWNNIVFETGLAALLALACALVLNAFGRGWISAKILPFILVAIFLGDASRVNDKFMFLANVPEKTLGSVTPVMEYLKRNAKDSRILPMNESDPMQYVANGVAVIYTPNPVQQVRWQEYLDAFNLDSSMPDVLNVKYLVLDSDQYSREKARFPRKYQPVFSSPDGGEVVLENRGALPKAWLVPSVVTVPDPVQRLSILQNPAYNPTKIALVETPPPIALAMPDHSSSLQPGTVSVKRYEGERIIVEANSNTNNLLVMGEKYAQGWRASVDGKAMRIYTVNHILRGVYLTPGTHRVEFHFEPAPFRVGKYLTIASFILFAAMLANEFRRRVKSDP